MRATTIVGLVMLLSGREALAQAPGEVPAEPAADKSVTTAYLLTVAAVSAPMAIVAIGGADNATGIRATALGVVGIGALVLGPSAGHWYAGEGITTGLLLRTGSAAALAGLAVRDPHLEHASTVVGLIAAVGLFETGVVWDLATLPRAVRRFNHEHAVAIAPLVTRDGGAGLSLAGTF